jgi:hypothetical protein
VKRSLLSLGVVLAAACSTAAKDIAPRYASPLPYQGYSCAQVASESARIDARTTALARQLDDAARHDRDIVAVGALLFLPALFALGGTKEQEAEYARLRGEREALQSIALAKDCVAIY